MDRDCGQVPSHFHNDFDTPLPDSDISKETLNSAKFYIPPQYWSPYQPDIPSIQPTIPPYRPIAPSYRPIVPSYQLAICTVQNSGVDSDETTYHCSFPNCHMQPLKRWHDMKHHYSYAHESISSLQPSLSNHSRTEVPDTSITEETDHVDHAETSIIKQERSLESYKLTFTPLQVIDTPAEPYTCFQPATKALDVLLLQPHESKIHQDVLEVDNSDTTYESSDACEFDLVNDIEAQKVQIVDRLIVCVYDMFSVRGSPTEHGHSSTNANRVPNDTSTPAAKERKETKRKRDHGKGGDDREGGNDEHDESKRRQKSRESSSISHQYLKKKLACPYYKQDPHKWNKHRACRGPGFDEVHRIKGHLYRAHAQAPHCRRCYTVFDTEDQLTQHLRCTESCMILKPISIDGFNEEQKQALKSRRTMFQAGSEEEKWKIVYLILFPDTALGDMPSPYHEPFEDAVRERQGHRSPQPPEIKRYNEFMNRELPKLLRTTWQSTLESSFGPLEETLKHQLVSAVRDVHESLTRKYFSSTQSSIPGATTLSEFTNKEDTDWPPVNGYGDVVTDTPETVERSHSSFEQTSVLSSGMIENPGTEQEPKSSNVTDKYGCFDAALPNHSGSDTLPQYFVPPNVDSPTSLQILPTDNSGTCGTSEDSAYFSNSNEVDHACFNEEWWQQIVGKSMDDILFECNLNAGAAPDSSTPDIPFDHEHIKQYTGKGKERADADTTYVGMDTLEFDDSALLGMFPADIPDVH